ncbi:MAG: nucleotidyltransferase [Polaromonas sp.]|nr:nucleotidyltransferase [Polaromonas sp.]
MKLLNHFKTFLEDHVNLNDTRLKLLTDSVEAVKKAVKYLDWEPKVVDFAVQGSWAHETIIKPQTGKAFDADLLVFVEAVEDWAPKDYVNTLATELGKLSAYDGKVRRFSHCATIEYAGVRKIDIAPCIVNRLYAGSYEVCNRGTDTFEQSEPKAYTDWVKDKNGIAGGNDLKKATRLLKYMRDIKGNFTCPSFLLTTLLGYRVEATDRYSNHFADLPTTFKTLVGRLDNWLQARPDVPSVMHPVLYGEDQADGWDQAKYSNFREKVNLYRGWVDDAYDEEDKEESIGKWRRVFGDGFAEGDTKRAAERISEAVATSDGMSLVAGNFYADLVAKVKALGQAAVPPSIRRLPHVERPKWRRASEQLTVCVGSELMTSKYGQRIRSIRSAEPLPARYSIKFSALNVHGTPFQTDDYNIKWRITNTDKVAAAADSLRGDFYDSEEGATRTEDLAYRGVHFVEAFVVRKRDQRLVGQSEPFYVVVE